MGLFTRISHLVLGHFTNGELEAQRIEGTPPTPYPSPDWQVTARVQALMCLIPES